MAFENRRLENVKGEHGILLAQRAVAGCELCRRTTEGSRLCEPCEEMVRRLAKIHWDNQPSSAPSLSARDGFNAPAKHRFWGVCP
jgi:hypothetical protein